MNFHPPCESESHGLQEVKSAAWMMADTQTVSLRRSPPVLIYVIACAPRTGSYLLCEGLEESGVVGYPTESLLPAYRNELCLRLYGRTTTFLHSVATVIEHGTGPNGVFGTKVHWAHLEALPFESDIVESPRAFLTQELPNARYIHLYREDSLAQAISLHRAHQTEEWWRIEGVDNPYRKLTTPTFDEIEILKLEKEMIRQRQAWEDFFEQNKISPLRLTYEELDRDYRGAIGKALHFLGFDPALAQGLPDPRIQKQADHLNTEWKARLESFLHDRK